MAIATPGRQASTEPTPSRSGWDARTERPWPISSAGAAPIPFDAFQRVNGRRTPLVSPPPGVVFAHTAQLPPALQRFRPDGLPEASGAGAEDAPLTISFPPNGSRIDLTASGDSTILALKAMGGSPPITWLVDGVPVVVLEKRRQAAWEGPSPGFARLSVIDAKGNTATSQVRLD